CRPVEIAWPIDYTTSGQQFGPRFDRIPHKAVDGIQAPLVLERTHLRLRIEGIHDTHVVCTGREPFAKSVKNILVGQEARWRRADLAGVAVLGGDTRGSDLVDVDIVPDDYRGVPAEFERGFLHVQGGLCPQLLADLGAAGEGNHGYQR